MKKKAVKKLTLAKETIRELEVSGLGQAQGGTYIYSYYCASYTAACSTIQQKSVPYN